ncbi:MAG TPA: undecaprenyldiphospho-muramoylpentapeptide beta-N-acetylglucosaminyltransferase [Gemmatimonadales bacterium]|nr:undecaprenyldiphospho-muramoylpentapeptide beta-N-acetylglucosaminyltransferase [Gemmatimonadales bacterium]
MSTVLIAGGGTGGHLMPALAIAAAVQQARTDTRVVLAGAERGVEAAILPTRPYPYALLPVEPIYRRQWWRNARLPVTGWRAVAAARKLLERERPDVVVGTGGYASGPVVWSAARRGIPTAIQEQNAFPGLATRWLARRVREIYLGVPEAAPRLNPGRGTTVIETGNPITPPNRSPDFRGKARNRFVLTGALPVVVVTGGSQGSLAINRQVAAWIDAGGGHDLQLIWVAGKTTVEEFRRYHRPPFVQVFDFLDPMAEAWAVADLVVARAGMMTIAELCAWGIPSILIPLPSAAADHQSANALALAQAGAAVHLPQASLKRGVLGAEIERLVRDEVIRTKLAECALLRGKPGAAAEIAGRILALAGP